MQQSDSSAVAEQFYGHPLIRALMKDGEHPSYLPARAFARYDETAGAWVWPPGEFAVRVGRSSADLRLSVRVKSLSWW